MAQENSGSTADKSEAIRPDPPNLTIDWELYGAYLEDSDLTEAEKREFIETLWSIVVSFVDLGFGIHPLQQACEEDQDLAEFIAAETRSVVNSQDISKTHFKAAASEQSGNSRANLSRERNDND
ncbi:MAG: hypothetical protein L3J67_13540 [Hyphomicrobiaceae bacterium]|nr:hypothetical protein [Hyphomicrobiaceae bacterium]